jgi:transposase
MLKQYRIKEMAERLYALEAMVAIQKETISSHEGIINNLRSTINSLEEKCAVKDALINKYRSMLFDTKSEKKFSTKNEDSDHAESPVIHQLTPSRPRGQQKGAAGHGRRQYNKLPLQEVFHELPADKRRCTKCGKPYIECGTEDSIELDFLILLQRRMNRRLKYRCTCDCDCDKIITAPSASKLIPKGLLSDGIITRLIINKFLHGQPINRQLNEFELHCGVRLAPGTIVGVLDKVSELLRPLYDHILLHLRDANHWHADETRWMQYSDEKKQQWWL